MKNLFKVVVCLVVLAAVAVGSVLLYRSVGPNDIELESGWQLIQIDGKIPKGAIVIVTENSNAVLPNPDPETKRLTGYVNQGRINFYEPMWIVTETPVWVFYPEEYEFIQKKVDFYQQCLDKLSELTGKKQISMSEYDVGHP